jgi:hypothetical protein
MQNFLPFWSVSFLIKSTLECVFLQWPPHLNVEDKQGSLYSSFKIGESRAV